MQTREFLSLLEDHKDKSLVFEYRPGERVQPNYHITEIKNITVESVDCGAGTDFWKETIVQLWESPEEKGKTQYMSAFKALGILNKVDRMKTMERNAELKIEYSNAHFHTAQLFVSACVQSDHEIIFKLAVEKTDCKAKEACGVPEVSASSEAACAPGSGCC